MLSFQYNIIEKICFRLLGRELHDVFFLFYTVKMGGRTGRQETENQLF